jgi:hypothetical protein
MAGRRPLGPLRFGSIAFVAIGAWLAASTTLAAGTEGTGTARPELPAAAVSGPPLLAYYYIWFDPPSWDRAKIDVPALGPYDSADPAVIAQHVAWAKAAGIDALIVSWKHEPRLDGPLEILVETARAAGLRLVLLYQGLDFGRQPIAVSQIEGDLAWFMDRYGSDPVFDVFGRPAVVLSGSPSFSDAAVAKIRSALEGDGPALLLGSERDGSSYAARSGLLDGDAYYWSSVDPNRDPEYLTRLRELGSAIHDDGGLWLAPVAPGFDARAIGGSRVIDRADGATYRAEWATALQSSPDGLAIISWNEFSENSHIEPSATFGSRYLELTAELVRDSLGRPAASDPVGALPSASGPVTVFPPVVSAAGPRAGLERWVAVLAAILILGPVLILARRGRRGQAADRQSILDRSPGSDKVSRP